MRRAARNLALCLASALAPASADAEVIDIAADLRLGAVPDRAGRGVPVRWVHGYFPGHPFHIDDARDLLDGVSFAPAFERWCGTLPYIDLGNRTTNDSQGRGAPTLLCAPFLDATQSAMVTCRSLPQVPAGRYWTNGGAAMRARGAIAIRAPGVYTFAWGHDDGVSFRIGRTPIYEFPDGTGARVDTASVRFSEAGLYPFVLEWFDGIGGAIIDWYVAPGEHPAASFASAPFTLVPTEDLFALDQQDCTASCEACAFPTPICDRDTGRCVRCVNDGDCGARAVCVEGACVATPRPTDHPDAGEDRADAANGSDLGAGAATLPPSAGGCGCAVRSVRPPALGLAVLAALVVRCSRRGRRRRSGTE